MVNENKLHNLEELTLSDSKDAFGVQTDSVYIEISLLKIQEDKLPSLKHLSLFGFIYSGEHIQHLGDRLVKWDLKELKLFRSKGISGHLSVLFSHCLPSLTYLVLINCELNSDDMRYLTEAREQGRLPKLEYLDVSLNWVKDKFWTINGAWKNVKILV